MCILFSLVPAKGVRDYVHGSFAHLKTRHSQQLAYHTSLLYTVLYYISSLGILDMLKT